jgi:hypothetical protein
MADPNLACAKRRNLWPPPEQFPESTKPTVLSQFAARAITLHRTSGLRRGLALFDTGSSLQVPVSEQCLGRACGFHNIASTSVVLFQLDFPDLWKGLYIATPPSRRNNPRRE